MDVKLYGRKTLTIEHRIDSINGAKIVVMEPRDLPSVEFAAAMNLTLPLSPPAR